MHIKYIVYYKDNNPIPCVDIWKTTGNVIHSFYASCHNIRPQDMSSCGELFFNASKKRWDLEHWQLDGFDCKSEKRDRALVQKKIYETEFLKGNQLRRQCPKISLLRRIFCFQHD